MRGVLLDPVAHGVEPRAQRAEPAGEAGDLAVDAVHDEGREEHHGRHRPAPPVVDGGQAVATAPRARLETVTAFGDQPSRRPTPVVRRESGRTAYVEKKPSPPREAPRSRCCHGEPGAPVTVVPSRRTVKGPRATVPTCSPPRTRARRERSKASRRGSRALAEPAAARQMAAAAARSAPAMRSTPTASAVGAVTVCRAVPTESTSRRAGVGPDPASGGPGRRGGPESPGRWRQGSPRRSGSPAGRAGRAGRPGRSPGWRRRRPAAGPRRARPRPPGAASTGPPGSWKRAPGTTSAMLSARLAGTLAGGPAAESAGSWGSRVVGPTRTTSAPAEWPCTARAAGFPTVGVTSSLTTRCPRRRCTARARR